MVCIPNSINSKIVVPDDKVMLAVYSDSQVIDGKGTPEYIPFIEPM